MCVVDLETIHVQRMCNTKILYYCKPSMFSRRWGFEIGFDLNSTNHCLFPSLTSTKSTVLPYEMNYIRMYTCEHINRPYAHLRTQFLLLLVQHSVSIST